MALINTVESNLASLLTTIKDSSLISNARTQVNNATAEIDSVTRAQILVNFELSLAQNLTQSALQTALAIETTEKQIESMTIEDGIKEGTYQDTLLTTAKQRLSVDKDIEFKSKQIESLSLKDALDEAQTNADVTLKASQKAMVDEQKNTEIKKQITETNQGDMLLAQASMVVAQTQEIAPNATKQRAVQDAQIAQVNRETNYTLAKTDVMVQSRLDNLIIETAKMQQQKVMGLGNGSLSPSANDFFNEAGLMQALYNRAKEESMPDLTIAQATTYTKLN